MWLSPTAPLGLSVLSWMHKAFWTGDFHSFFYPIASTFMFIMINLLKYSLLLECLLIFTQIFLYIERYLDKFIIIKIKNEYNLKKNEVQNSLGFFHDSPQAFTR